MKILMYPIFIYRTLTKASILSPEARKETKRTYVKNKYLKKIYFSNDSSIEIKFFSKTNWEKSQSIPICLSLFFRLVDTKNILRKLISMMWNMNLWARHWHQLNKLYNYKWKWEYFPVYVF